MSNCSAGMPTPCEQHYNLEQNSLGYNQENLIRADSVHIYMHLVGQSRWTARMANVCLPYNYIVAWCSFTLQSHCCLVLVYVFYRSVCVYMCQQQQYRDYVIGVKREFRRVLQSAKS